MYSPLWLILTIGISNAAANWCGTETPSDSIISTHRKLRDAEKVNSHLVGRQSATITVPVYFHAVVNTTNDDEILNEDILQAQFDVIVDRFKPHDISFTLEGTDRIVDDELAQGLSSQSWIPHVVSSRKGSYSTLNIWYATNMNPSIGGSCTIPGVNVTPGSITRLMDGCTLQSYSVPGNKFNGTTYTGEISVHEVGHWFGLLHTFAGDSCDGPGDYVDDTPAEASYEFMACPVGKDTCPEQEGLDPIDNFSKS